MRAWRDRNGIMTPTDTYREATHEELMEHASEWADESGRANQQALVRSRAEMEEKSEENDPRPAQRPRTDNDRAIVVRSNGNLPDGDQEMEDVGTQPGNTSNALVAFTGGGGGGANPQSKETPITPAQPSYGLQETHTTVIPYNFYFSSTGMDKDTANVMEIRMNSPVDVCVTPLSTITTPGTTKWGKGLYNVPFNNSATSGSPLGVFPRTMATGTNTTERPFWWDYWRKIYDYYTVLGCEYEITIRNPSSPGGNEVLVGTQFDTYSTVETETGNIWPRNTPLAEAVSHRHIQWKIVNSETNGDGGMKHDSAAVIAGTYRPGQNRRNIINDGDVKTWTKTNSPTDPAQTSLKESLTLLFWRAPLAYGANTTTGTPPAPVTVTDTRCGVNVEVKLKYLIQFKDLKEAARYPYTTNTVSVTRTLPTDALATAGA